MLYLLHPILLPFPFRAGKALTFPVAGHIIPPSETGNDGNLSGPGAQRGSVIGCKRSCPQDRIKHPPRAAPRTHLGSRLGRAPPVTAETKRPVPKDRQAGWNRETISVPPLTSSGAGFFFAPNATRRNTPCLMQTCTPLKTPNSKRPIGTPAPTCWPRP